MAFDPLNLQSTIKTVDTVTIPELEQMLRRILDGATVEVGGVPLVVLKLAPAKS